jgi:hypothetical protein
MTNPLNFASVIPPYISILLKPCIVIGFAFLHAWYRYKLYTCVHHNWIPVSSYMSAICQLQNDVRAAAVPDFQREQLASLPWFGI